MMKLVACHPMLGPAALALAACIAVAMPHRAVSGSDEQPQMLAQAEQGEEQVIPPSTVYRIAMQYMPGCTVLRVSLDKAAKTYAVKVKSGNEVRKLLVDARTGEVVGD
jgi:uncharacterized membrane protein YkoI